MINKISNNVKSKREKMSLTQSEVAKKAQVSERGYQYIEAGDRLPNVQTAQLIAKALDTTVEEIFPLSDH